MNRNGLNILLKLTNAANNRFILKCKIINAPSSSLLLINSSLGTSRSSSSGGGVPPINLKNVKANKSGGAGGGGYEESSKNAGKLSALALLTIPLTTLILGCWQIQRREWKLNLIKTLESRTSAPPISLSPSNLSVIIDNPEYEYRSFKVKGRFIHSEEILLTTRTDLTGQSKTPGAHVITPFELSETDANGNKIRILVNRGFIPYTHYSLAKRIDANKYEQVEIVGLLRLDEVKNTFTPNNNPIKNEWHYRDLKTMAICLDTEKIFLDAVYNDAIAKLNGPIGGQTVIQLRNEHLTYIVTWFTLCALTSFMWYKKFFKRFV